MNGKRSVLALCIIMICLLGLVGCGEKNTNQGNLNNGNTIVENQGNVENNNTTDEGEAAAYYFYNNRFMGSLENGTWYSPLSGLNGNLNVKQWKYSELLDQEKYYLNDKNNVNSPVNQVGISLEYGIGGFFQFSEESDKYIEELGKYVKETENYISKLEFPVKLEGELIELKSSFENTNFYFPNTVESSIVTNVADEIKFVDADTNFEMPETLNNYLTSYEIANNLNPEIEYVLKSSYTVDINGDGKEDKIYAFNSSDVSKDDIDEINSIVKKYGQIALVVAEIENEFIKLYDSSIGVNASDEEIFNNSRIVRLDVADLDNNNDYECVYTISVPGGQMTIFADYKNGTIEEIACNYSGQ